MACSQHREGRSKEERVRQRVQYQWSPRTSRDSGGEAPDTQQHLSPLTEWRSWPSPEVSSPAPHHLAGDLLVYSGKPLLTKFTSSAGQGAG